MCVNEIEELEEIVANAITTFNEKEQYLIEKDLSERCICARFAMFLTEALRNTRYEDYIVDVEYNRGFAGHDRSIKRIDNARIVVDLIVHKRGYNPIYGYDNLICIEMKKSTNRRGFTSDENRLRKMTDENCGFCYKLGIMLEINIKSVEIKIKSVFVKGRNHPFIM